MYDRYMTGGRYGIWGQNEAPMPMGPSVDPLQQAMGTASGIQNLFGNYYKNKLAGLDAGLKQNQLNYSNQTLQDAITAANTKNQTDTQYYPLMQQAKLQQDEQTVKEIMSRTGLNYAQAKMALAHIPLLQAQANHENALSNAQTNPAFMYDALKQQMDASPNASPRKAYFGGLLNSMLSQSVGGMPVTDSGRGKNSSLLSPGMGGRQTSQGVSAVPSVPGLTVNPMTVSRSSNKGAEYAQTDDSGNTTVYTSPTTPTVTGLQSRLGAENELKTLSPTMDAGIAPYVSTYGANVAYPHDLVRAKMGDKNAQARVDAAESAMQLIREKAILRIRQASPNAEIGEGQINEMVKQMYPNMPAHFLRGFNSASNIAQSTRNVDRQLANANQVAAQMVSSNYPTPVDQPPVWDKSTSGLPQMGKFDLSTGEYIPPQMAPQGESTLSQQPSLSQAIPQNSPQISDSRQINGTQYVRIGQKWHRRK